MAAPPQAFVFPEQYSFPPFFTIQPVLATRQKQIRMWAELVIAYLQFHRKSVIRVLEDSKSDLFYNTKIDRKLSSEGVQAVLQELTTDGYGEWLDDKRSTCLVSWKKFDEWGRAILAWATENDLLDNVATLYEVQDASGTEFRGLDANLLLTALRSLQRQGKVSLIPGDTVSETVCVHTKHPETTYRYWDARGSVSFGRRVATPQFFTNMTTKNKRVRKLLHENAKPGTMKLPPAPKVEDFLECDSSGRFYSTKGSEWTGPRARARWLGDDEDDAQFEVNKASVQWLPKRREDHPDHFSYMRTRAGQQHQDSHPLFLEGGTFQSPTSRNIGFLHERHETKEENATRWSSTYTAACRTAAKGLPSIKPGTGSGTATSFGSSLSLSQSQSLSPSASGIPPVARSLGATGSDSGSGASSPHTGAGAGASSPSAAFEPSQRALAEGRLYYPGLSSASAMGYGKGHRHFRQYTNVIDTGR